MEESERSRTIVTTRDITWLLDREVGTEGVQYKEMGRGDSGNIFCDEEAGDTGTELAVSEIRPSMVVMINLMAQTVNQV